MEDQNSHLAATDEEFAALFLERPDSYREAFACRCANLLRGYIRRLVFGGMCPNSASKETFSEDVYSLALTKLPQALPQLRIAAALRTWLKTIARSAVVDETLDRIRRTAEEVAFESLDDMIARAADEPKMAQRLEDVERAAVKYESYHWSNPEEAAIKRERWQAFMNAFDEHSAASGRGAECGAVVAMHYSNEMSFGQIAGILERPKSTVHELFDDNMIAYRRICLRAHREEFVRSPGSTS